ncbi:hypothetical protein NEF87_000243 [Candidatus Lokiarchaeum ossiferum]|uniref:Uncharacterized protein n=1 Tax=Candidatus Lokiarchaeum ossiferum TaxID=2951803 RepID=A0ABY6HKB4_9ARCH|nr:hypothetical protein NEF87_000243 [Candidatus Lokiarchaeum sp. B-35]
MFIFYQFKNIGILIFLGINEYYRQKDGNIRYCGIFKILTYDSLFKYFTLGIA